MGSAGPQNRVFAPPPTGAFLFAQDKVHGFGYYINQVRSL